MMLGLKLGATGPEVARLQTILRQSGHSIGEQELARLELGATTLAALRAFQSQVGLALRDEVDQATLTALLAAERSHDQSWHHRGLVVGSLVDDDGVPLVGRKVALFRQEVRSESTLGEAHTSHAGFYRIEYERFEPLDLTVRAYDEGEKVIARFRTVFAAPAAIEIDLTTAPDGIPRPLGPSNG